MSRKLRVAPIKITAQMRNFSNYLMPGETGSKIIIKTPLSDEPIVVSG
jgi:hypothetical protein